MLVGLIVPVACFYSLTSLSVGGFVICIYVGLVSIFDRVF